MNTQVNDPKGAAGALKAPMHLIPPYATEQTAWVQKLGAEKYGPYNWRKTGVCATTYVSAIMRHLNAWRDGEDLDPESGISHIAHIASSCNILLDAGHCGTLQDDRNKKPPVPLTFAAAVAKDEAVKEESVALDQRVLPIPSGWTLPLVPEGYDRWVYRGTFKGHTIVAKDRHILYDFKGDDWHKTIAFSGVHHHIEAVKDEPVALDQRVLPIPSEWDLPPVPEGYDRWVYRGTFKDEEIIAKDRFIAYSFRGADWRETSHFSAGYHHIEAIKKEPVTPYGLPPYPPVPEGYTRWMYRGKGWKTDRRVCFATAVALYDLAWVVFPFGCTVGWQHVHYIEAVKD